MVQVISDHLRVQGCRSGFPPFAIIVSVIVITQIKSFMKNWIKTILALSVLGFAACSDDSTDGVDRLTRDTDALELAYNKDASGKISVRVPGAWQATVVCKDADGATVDQSWLTLDPDHGVGNGVQYQYLTVVATRNTGGKRTAVVTLSSTTRNESVTVDITQDDGTFSVSNPSLYGSLQANVESQALLQVDYDKALGGEDVSMKFSFEGNSRGLSIDDYAGSIPEEGKGSLMFPIKGVPSDIGTVKLKMLMKIDGRTIFDDVIALGIQSENIIFEQAFSKMKWGGDLMANKKGMCPGGKQTSGQDVTGLETADGEVSVGTDGAGDAFKSMGDVYRANRDLTGWSGERVYEHPGYIKLGTGSNFGWLMTPAMASLTSAPQTVVVSFDVCLYDGSDDAVIFSVEGSGSIEGGGEILLPSFSGWANAKWTTVTKVVNGATSATKFKWTTTKTDGKGRFVLDNISVMSAAIKERTEPLDKVNAEAILYTPGATSIAVSWPEVPDATAYDIALIPESNPMFANRVKVTKSEGKEGVFTYDFTNLAPGFYLFEVVAVYEPNVQFNSEKVSMKIGTEGFVAGPLKKPEVLFTTTAWTASISWKAVSGASGYKYTFSKGGVVIETKTVGTDVTSLNYDKLTEATSYTIAVQALYESNADYNSPVATHTESTKALSVAAPTGVKLAAQSTSSLTFAWDDVHEGRSYTMQLASKASDENSNVAEFSYTWGTKSTTEAWPWAFPIRFTYVSLMNADRTMGDNRLKPATTYYFRVRCGGASDEAYWSNWMPATTAAAHSAVSGELFYEAFDRCCVGGGDWYNLAACGIAKDKSQTDITNIKWSAGANSASSTFGNLYTASNISSGVYDWIGYERLWSRENGKGDIQPLPGYLKCGNGSNPGAFTILPLSGSGLAAAGESVTFSFKITPWCEVTGGDGYTMDSKHVEILVNGTVVSGLEQVLISDSQIDNADQKTQTNPQILADMKWKQVSVTIPSLKPTDKLTIRALAGGWGNRGRFFIDEVSVVKK